MSFHHSISLSLIVTAFGLLQTGCGSSDKAALASQGVVTGTVTQVLHHGAYNPDGPNKTVTMMRGLELQVMNGDGKIIARPVTDAEGKFRLALPAGSYVLLPPEMGGEDAPTSAPSPERIEVHPGDSLDLTFQYAIFAP